MDERIDDLNSRISEPIERAYEARTLPWQQPGVESVALDEEGRVTRYLATATGFVVLGHVEP